MGRPSRLDGFSSIHSQDLAEIRDHDVFGHVQAQDAPEDSEAKQPEVERDQATTPSIAPTVI